MMALLACAQEWSPEAAMRPTLEQLDRSGDGRVTAEEYERVAWRAPPFPGADEALSAAELVALQDAQDPLTFDGTEARGAPDPALGPGMSGTMTPAQRHAWELLYVLADEARAAGQAVPADHELDGAVRAGLASPQGQAVLARLRVAWAQAGLTFPDPG